MPRQDNTLRYIYLISPLSLSDQACHILKCLTGRSNNVHRGSESKLDQDDDEPNPFKKSISLRTVASAPLYCKKEGGRGRDADICTKNAYHHR